MMAALAWTFIALAFVAFANDRDWTGLLFSWLAVACCIAGMLGL